MASTIPRTYRKEITDALEGETLYVAFFTNSMSTWTGLSAVEKTYAQVATIYTESTGTGYTIGGVPLPVTSANMAGNAANINADDDTELTISTALTARFAVVYNHTSGLIRSVTDLGGDYTVTSGKMTIVWDAVNGVIKCS